MWLRVLSLPEGPAVPPALFSKAGQLSAAKKLFPSTLPGPHDIIVFAEVEYFIMTFVINLFWN